MKKYCLILVLISLVNLVGFFYLLSNNQFKINEDRRIENILYEHYGHKQLQVLPIIKDSAISIARKELAKRFPTQDLVFTAEFDEKSDVWIVNAIVKKRQEPTTTMTDAKYWGLSFVVIIDNRTSSILSVGRDDG